jgi:hypothetical protein
MDEELEVMNALSDGPKNFEQLYRSVCLEFCAEQYRPSDPNAFYWRANDRGLNLGDVADALVKLVRTGYVSVKDDAGQTIAPLSEAGPYLWKAWFELSDTGRQDLLRIPGRLGGRPR